MDREKVMSWLEGLAEDESMMFHSFSEVGNIARSALELLKEQQEQIDKLIEENASNAEMAEGLKELLKEQEAVVRCNDCKYNDDGECIIKAGWFPVKSDWFCADGERREQ